MRQRFLDHGIYAVNVVSSPGAGKTELLAALIRHMGEADVRVAAVVGDLATERDADRLAAAGAPARQILTGTMCHLEADMVENALTDLDLTDIDLLFIENVGNLVCPQSWDLGEDLRLLLFPCTEGEDKPLKYPTLINTCDRVVFSKMDLAAAVEFDAELARGNCQAVRPGIPMVETSARTGAGVAELASWIADRVREKGAGEVAGPTRA